jgi:tetratricopeptide (TPR) repeat protein
MNLKFHDTIEFVKSLDEDIASNPLIQLEYAIALYELENYNEAAPIFESIVDNNPNTDWATEADNYLGLTEAMISKNNSPKK